MPLVMRWSLSERESTESGGARRSSSALRRVLTAIGARLAFAVVTLLAMSIITFAATSWSPEDVARTSLGREVSKSQLDVFVKEHGLDRPLTVRYGEWLLGIVRGDFGKSLVTRRDVESDVMPRLQRTVIIAVLALITGLPIAIGLAVFMAQRAGRWPDIALSMVSTVFTALPEFVTGIALILIFGVVLGWLPIDSSSLMFGSALMNLDAYVLPVVTMVLVTVPYTVRIARSAIRESLAADHTQAALLRGLPRQRVLWQYAVLPAAVPIINTLALNLVYLISGVVVIENVFNFPGIGRRTR